jgi:uncharacterized protein YgiM (DUF1202 family)
LSGSRTIAQTRWLALSLVVAFCLTLLSPIAVTVASTNLTSGDDAVIIDANGDPVRLRTKPGLNGAVVAEFSEGAAVHIVDGPQISDDGQAWYRVNVDGETGYMAAEFLALAGVAEPESTLEPAPIPTSEEAAADESLVVAAEVTGSATIVNTNGDPIRCRASANTDADILGLLYEGMSVDLTGSPQGSWQPVRCENGAGWVHIEFLSDLVNEAPVDVATDSLVEEASETGSGTIAGTNGDGVRCRNKASTSGAVITTLAEGSSVGLRGAPRGDWQGVTCAGRRGYVWAEFVSTSSPGGGDTGGDNGSDVTGTGVIVNTNGDGLRCRKKASFDGEIITVLVEGTEVELRGSKKGDWQPIYCDGKKGYVHADFVGEAGSGGDPGGGNNGGGSTSGLNAGDTAQVSGTNGQGVRLRSSASSSASVITVLAEGENADVRSGSTGDWVAVTYRGSNGFVHKDYLIEATDDNDDDQPHDELANGDHAKVTSSLNFRSGASTSSDVLGVAMEGIVVLITGQRQNGYFPVEWGGIDGFMHGDYLQWSDDALSPGAGSGTGGVTGDAGDGSPSAVGRQMVDYAMNYLGYPYIWATAGPNSFDCSGFTYWVTKHVLGQDIGRGLWTQVVAGTPVSYGNLRPGDIVFFQNTYTWGLSHVGIYIGNNQFIHAENEDTGVRISSITSTYYSTRYYGAVRLG